MSAVEHQATVDKGLKMKIKRKNGATSKTDRHEIVKTELKTHHSDSTSQSANGILAEQTSKLSLMSDRDKLLKMKGQCRKDKGKEKVVKSGESMQNGGATAVTTTTSISVNSVTGVKDMGSFFGQSGNAEPKPGETPSNTKKDSVQDPYEFNAKLEDVVTMPKKKIKLEKMDSISATPSHKHPVYHHDVATETNSVGVITEPDCLGPCEPGTSVTLEGIVWHETENGVLVVNVTWRGKTYVGTLLDATRHDWAPPRFNCESPVSDFDIRTPKGRGKRGRAAINTPVTDRPTSEQGRKLRKGRRGSSASTFQAPPSPARSDISTSSGTKRKGRPTDIDLTCEGGRSNKRSKPNSQESTPVAECPSPTLIECPEPNCNKKYKHINGLRYHQSHAHQNTGTFEEEKDEEGEDSAPLTPNKRGPKDKETCKKEVCKKEICKDANESVENLKTKNSELSMIKKDESKIDDSKAEIDISKELKSQKKQDEKSDIIAAKCKDNNNTTTICSSSKPIVAPTKPPTTCPSIFSVATNSVANLTSVTCSTAVVAQPGSPTSSVNSTASTKPSISNALPITVTAITTLTQSLEIKSEPAKLDKNSEKQKVKPSTRPIIPAPAPQMIASVTVTHTNLAPVTSHTQVSPQLKPIQPKPTIMGEPANINPALVGLNKKKVPKKKGKDIPPGAVKVEVAKLERTPVIKANPQPNKIPEIRKDVNSLDAQRMVATQPQSIAVSGSANAGANRGVDLSHAARPTSTSLLKVNSPLQVSTSDHCKTPITDDVQSPAYSDISDANESASPAQTESPQKQREEHSNGSSNNKKDEAPLSQPSTPKNENPNVIPHFGMYGYYGQPGFPVSNMSPVQMPAQQQQQQSQHQQQPQHSSTQKPPAKVVASKDAKGCLPDEKARQTSEDIVKQERKEVEEKESSKVKAEGMGVSGSNMTQQQLYEYQMQQKQLHDMYAMQQLPPHLQWAYGGYYVNPAYMHYEKMLEEQRRAHQETGKGDGGRDTGPRTSDDKLQDLSQTQKRTVDSLVSVIPKSSPNASVTQSGSTAEKSADGKKNVEKSLDGDYKDQSLRDKQSENHQIMKENIDLKAQMDKTRQESYERFRHAEEQRRYQMYHHQRLIEERKRSEKVDLRPENLSSKAPGTKPIQETSSRDQNRGHGSVHHSDDLLRPQHMRKESGDSSKSKSKEGLAKESMEGKHIEKIEKLADDKNKYLLQDKQKNAENHGTEAHKHKVQSQPHGRSSKTGSPSTSSNGPLGPSSIPGSPSTSFPSYYPYIQTSPYGHMPVDPNHPIYRGAAPPGFTVNPAVIGYPSPYIHPSQVGYRLSAEEEKEKSKLGQTQLVDLDISKPKSELGHGSQYYGSNMHKIHELQDKARPSSRSSSPVVQKSTTPVSSQSSSSFSEKHREYSNSPPTQRHVHTHHHTHVVGIPQGTFAPVYDAYSLFAASPASTSIPQHPFPQK